MSSDLRRELYGPMGQQPSETKLVLVDVDSIQVWHTRHVDHEFRDEQALLEHQDERSPTRHQPGLVAVLPEQVEGLLQLAS